MPSFPNPRSVESDGARFLAGQAAAGEGAPRRVVSLPSVLRPSLLSPVVPWPIVPTMATSAMCSTVAPLFSLRAFCSSPPVSRRRQPVPRLVRRQLGRQNWNTSDGSRPCRTRMRRSLK